MIFDTHCHLYDAAFDADRADVIARARQAGVGCIVLPCESADTVGPILSVCDAYPGYCRPAIGLHPENVGADVDLQLAQLRPRLEQHAWVAIGEVGMDLYWDKTYAAQQAVALERQVAWAVELGLPLIIHCRKAFDETFRVLRRFDPAQLRGIFHCFSGSMETAREIARCGDFMLGIGGVLTFKNSGLPSVLESLPVDRLVLETDAPYLAPVPHRGKRNESSFLPAVVQRLSEIYRLTPAEVERITTRNAEQLFGVVDD